MPVFVMRRDSPRDGSLPRRHLSPDCPALLDIEDESVERVRNTSRLRERTQRCREGCWTEYEIEHEGALVTNEAQLGGASPGPAWPIKRSVTLLDATVNGPEEHPFAEIDLQWLDASRVRVTLLGGAPAQIRQAHLTGKPGQDNVVLEFESPLDPPTPIEPRNAAPRSFIPRGTEVTSRAQLAALLRRWYSESGETYIGDLDEHRGDTAWIKITIDGHRFRMHADTTRTAIERYLELVDEHGANLPWHVEPTSRSEAVRKVCVEPDASPTPGLFIYSNAAYDEPFTL